MAVIKKIKVGGVSYDISLGADILTGIISGYGIGVFEEGGTVLVSGMINSEKNTGFSISGERYVLGFDKFGFYISSGE